MVTLKSSGADLFYNITTPKFGAQAIKKAAELGWKPVQILDINATPVSQTLVPAGLENAKGIISVNYGKDPLDPQWANDEGMKRYKAFMAKYAPAEDANSGIATYGYSTAALLVQILKQCGDDLTRANIMKQATNIKGFVADLALPGMTISTEPDDWRINKQFQMMKFDGQRWVLFGPILTDELQDELNNLRYGVNLTAEDVAAIAASARDCRARLGACHARALDAYFHSIPYSSADALTHINADRLSSQIKRSWFSVSSPDDMCSM